MIKNDFFLIMFAICAFLVTACAHSASAFSRDTRGTSVRDYGDSPPPFHDYASDITVVPDGVIYLRIEPVAYPVARPFPKIFLSDGHFEVNEYINETNITLQTADVLTLIENVRSLPCARELAGTDEEEYLHLTMRGQGSRLSTCSLRPSDACDYLASLTAEKIGRRYNLSEVRELARRMEC